MCGQSLKLFEMYYRIEQMNKSADVVGGHEIRNERSQDKEQSHEDGLELEC